ncbi:MAG: MFS transporter [Myxococcaceae bacterium]|nr:MFS transporter [Myxococcaceae bacterium]
MTAIALTVSNRILQAFFGSVGGLSRTFWFLWSGALINRIGSFVMPMLAVYLTKERGLSIVEAGSVVSLFGLGGLSSVQLAGVLADRLGRRATMLVSLVTSAGSMLALGFAVTAPQLMVAAFALGFTASIYSPASQAMLADVVPPADRQRAFGLLYWAINLGFAIAAVLGGQLARWSFTGLFIVDACSTLVTALVIFCNVPETKPAEAPQAKAEGTFLAPFFDVAFLPFLLVHLLLVLVFFQFQVALPADLQSKGFGSAELGIVMALNGVLIVALQPWATRRTHGWRRSRILALAALCVGFGFGLNAFAEGLPVFMASVAIWTMGEVLMAPANASIVADLSPAHMRGRYQGAFSVIWALGVTLGPWLSGKIITATSTRTLWFGCVVVGSAAALGHLLLGRARLARLQALNVEGARD